MLSWFGAIAPWDILSGEVNIDVLEGPRQVVVSGPALDSQTGLSC